MHFFAFYEQASCCISRLKAFSCKPSVNPFFSLFARLLRPLYSACLQGVQVALGSQTVLDFLAQRHKKLCCCISDIMDIFLAGNDQPQTDQPDSQASG